MLVDIKYNGITASTSDYECPDGDLDVALGIDLNEYSAHSAYKPTLQFKLPQTDNAAWQVLCVHHTADFNHYIVGDTIDGNRHKLAYIDASTTPQGSQATVQMITPTTTDAGLIHRIIDEGYKVCSVCPMGNTLVLTVEDTATGKGKMLYLLWRNGQYVYLGDDIPDVNLQFGLVACGKFYSDQLYDAESDGKRNGYFKLTVPDRTEAELLDFTDKQKDSVSPIVMGKVARFINEVGNKRGRFIYPFYVRYAYRLYDGSYTHHSAPVLMSPCSDQMPIVIAQNSKTNEDCNKLEYCDIFATPCTLDWRITDKSALERLAVDWKDIVQDICIFVSPPIYTYDQSGKTEGLELLRQDAQTWFNTPFSNLMLARFSNNFNDPDEPEGYLNDFYFRNGRDLGTGDSYSDDWGDHCNSIIQKIEKKLSPLNDTYQWWDVMEVMKLMYMGVAQYIYGENAKQKYAMNPKSVYRVILPKFSDEDIRDKIKNTSSFYLLKTLEIDTMQYSGQVNDLDPQYLGALTAHERLPDDFLSHETKFPKMLRSYNSRLNIGNITRYAFSGYSFASMFPRQTAFRDVRLYHSDADKLLTLDSWLNSAFITRNLPKDVTVRYTIETDSGKQIITGGEHSDNLFFSDLAELNALRTSSDDTLYTSCRLPAFIYYPTLNCKQVAIYRKYSGKSVCVLSGNMEQHAVLYGSCYLCGFGSSKKLAASASGLTSDTIPELSADNSFSLPNTVYVSEVNNPFQFSAVNTVSVGSGSLLGIVPAVEALSQGQFGEYPMYAFTDEGVWSLRPNDQGVYTTVRPVSRDVCNNADSITQIDHSVIFSTAQGLMMLNGTTTTCLSDTLDALDAFSIDSLPNLKEYLSSQGVDISSTPSVPFRTFLNGALELYDYANKRIIVYSPATDSNGSPLYSYAYVYYLKSKRWGIIPSSTVASANTYPDAIAQDSEGNVIDLSQPDYLNAYKGVIVTRPFKLDLPNVFKTVDTIIQRGKLSRDHVKQILYASNDLINWLPVWSSNSVYMRGFRGTPYKFFKLALYCNLSQSESLYGFTVQFTPRLQDQPR